MSKIIIACVLLGFVYPVAMGTSPALAGVAGPSISPAEELDALVGTPITSYTMSGGGSGSTTYYEITPSPLAGLTFDVNTGMLSGTPTTTGDVQYTITRHYDSERVITPMQFHLVVSQPVLPAFPAFRSLVYGETGEIFYFDNTQGVSGNFGFDYSLDGGSTWVTLDPSDPVMYCLDVGSQTVPNLTSCSVIPPAGSARVLLRYNNNPTNDPTIPTFPRSAASEEIDFTVLASLNASDYWATFAPSYTAEPREAGLHITYTAPLATTLGPFRNIYYAYAPQIGDPFDLTPSEMKLVDGQTTQNWDISGLTNGVSYQLPLAYYVPDLPVVGIAAINVTYATHDGNGGSSPYPLNGTPAPTPPTISHPLANSTLVGSVGSNFSDQVLASGGLSPYSYANSGGILPLGLSLDPATGIISGIPTSPGIFVDTVSVTSASGGVATIEISFNISALPVTRPDNYYWIDHPTPDPTEGGVSWDWTSLATSADGSHIVGVTDQGVILTSSDYGNTWVNESTTAAVAANYWYLVTSSSDGSHLAASAYAAGIWTSENYGVTWSQTNSPLPQEWSGLASSSDGTHLAGVASGGDIFVSHDGGVSWTDIDPVAIAGGTGTYLAGASSSIASSADGSRLIVVLSNGAILISTDYGVTWSVAATSGVSNYGAVTSSSDGRVLTVGSSVQGDTQQILISTDFGATFKPGPISLVGGWLALTSSSDGSHLAAIVNSAGFVRSQIWTSPDYGATWAQISSSDPAWQNSYFGTLASNADGSFLIAAGNDSDLWSGPAQDYDATLASGTIRGVSVANLGTPSQSLATVIPGVDTQTLTTILDRTLLTEFVPSSPNASVTKIVKYARGASDATFATDASFNNLAINDGDYFDIEVTSEHGTKLYYKINVTRLSPTIAPDFTASANYFGPTQIGTTETQTVQIHALTSKSDWSYGGSACGCGFSPIESMQSSIGTFTFNGDPNVVTNGCFAEISSDYFCNIVISFTATHVGTELVPLKLDFLWTDTNTSLTGDEHEIVAFYASSVPAIDEPNPPFVWESQTVAASQSFKQISSSADGVRLSAVVNGGYVYTSSDSGKNWTRQDSAGQRPWTGIASSSDGLRLAASTYGGDIYTSSDGGITWIDRPAPISPDFNGGANGHGSYNKTWTSIASSADGLKLAIVDSMDSDGGDIYTSSDGGASWIDRSSLFVSGSISWRPWNSIASSADGMHLVATADDGTSVYTSNDQGVTWTIAGIDGPSAVSTIAVNSIASKVYILMPVNDYYGYIDPTGVGHIFFSSTFGTEWNPAYCGSTCTYIGPQVTDHWDSVATSSDGSHVAVVSHDGYIYTSADYGITWDSVTVPGPQNWTTIAMSADGSLLTAGTAYGDIWTLRSTYVPPVPATPSFIPTPQQMSKIDSLSPPSGNAGMATPLVLNGTFVEKVLRILVNGIEIPPDSWKQRSTSISFLMPLTEVGSYSIELFNGSSPLLPTQQFILKSAQVTDSSTNSSPTPQAPTATGNSTNIGTKPLTKTLSTNIYFEMASYSINPANLIKLEALAKRLLGLGTNITIAITGYAQPTPGSEATDGLLSKRRAAEVARVMRKYGVNTKVIYKGAGRAAINESSSRYVRIVAANR